LNGYRRLWLTVLLGVGLAVALIGHSLAPASAQSTLPFTSPTTELRGVWLTNIDSDVLFSRDNLRHAIQRLKRLNFNTIYPTVWNWGYTLYPSRVAERVVGRSLDPHPGLARRDMLAEAVNRGHRRGMTVIPWIEFGLMAPADSDLVSRHPDWVTNRLDGSQVIYEGTHPRVWLNPAHPEVRQMLLDLVNEIVTNYDVDGIQFDDHFGMPVELGYDPYTVRLYQQEHGGSLPPDDPHDLDWIRWRADKITSLMTEVFRTVKAQKPRAIVSLSPNPWEFAYETYLQDWLTWERRGLIEELIVQVYRDDFERFTSELQRPEIQLAKTHIPVAIGILTGLRNRFVSMEQIQTQVQAVREHQFAGVSFFFYETLGDRDAGFRSLFRQPVTRPRVG
jgi:uncharacterized lipoprotein YddW (UPF0748 family)